MSLNQNLKADKSITNLHSSLHGPVLANRSQIRCHRQPLGGAIFEEAQAANFQGIMETFLFTFSLLGIYPPGYGHLEQTGKDAMLDFIAVYITQQGSSATIL